MTTTMDDAVLAHLKSGLAIGKMTVPPGGIEKLGDFLALLEKWNKVFNLTAVRDATDAVSVHLLDSLSALPLVQGSRVLDVGSGGGLPGIPFAIARPELQLVVLDSNTKKCAFLRQCAAELRLANVQVVESRVEDYRAEPGFDTIVSRAFAELARFVGTTRHLLAENGRWLALKGASPDAEIARLPAGVDVVRVERLDVPFLDAERHAVILQPTRKSEP